MERIEQKEAEPDDKAENLHLGTWRKNKVLRVIIPFRDPIYPGRHEKLPRMTLNLNALVDMKR